MFVEALLPIGQTFDAMSRQNRMIDRMDKQNELTQRKLDQADRRMELKQRELDTLDEWSKNKSQAIQSSIQQYGNHVQLQMPPAKDLIQPNAGRPQMSGDGNFYPTFEQVDGWTGSMGNSF